MVIYYFRPWITSDAGFHISSLQLQVNYKNVAIKAGDVLMWQMLASVIIPGALWMMHVL